MVKRALSITGVLLALTVTVVAAAGRADRLETSRMTVLKVDAERSRFQCVEHGHWAPVVKTDLVGVGPGDIVRVSPQAGKPSRLFVLRTAAEEISSPER